MVIKSAMIKFFSNFGNHSQNGHPKNLHLFSQAVGRRQGSKSYCARNRDDQTEGEKGQRFLGIQASSGNASLTRSFRRAFHQSETRLIPLGLLLHFDLIDLTENLRIILLAYGDFVLKLLQLNLSLGKLFVLFESV